MSATYLVLAARLASQQPPYVGADVIPCAWSPVVHCLLPATLYRAGEDARGAGTTATLFASVKSARDAIQETVAYWLERRVGSRGLHLVESYRLVRVEAGVE